MSRRYALQFKVVLQEIEPVIWRRFQISDLCDFWSLHVAIQDAMGWWDAHLHQFEVLNPETKKMEIIGIPEYIYGEEPYGQETLAGWEIAVRHYMDIKENHKLKYLYDFGDSWKHWIYFEGKRPKPENQKYPICLDGARACPPEDVGATCGYYNFLSAINDPLDEEHDRLLEWIGGEYDAEKFDPKQVRFDNPTKRWNQAFDSE